AIYVFTHYLAAAIPLAADAIFSRLGTPPRPTCSLRGDFYNLTPGTPVTLGEILFSKIEESGPEEASSTGSAKKGPAREGGKAKGGEGKAVKEKVPKEKQSAQKTVEGTEETEQHDFTKIELRVGRIVRVWNHEKAERLFCEEIDVGEDVPRQIASGLRDHYSLEDMHNRKVIVVCNLKEAKLVGFSSNGMVLAAKCADGQVQLVAPPEDAVVGERVFIEGIPNVDAFSPSRVKKFKVWESLFSPQLRTDADCVATWGGLPLLTSAGRCYVE
ncbi:AIMP1, partial [Symbiodinium microadriaticum]